MAAVANTILRLPAYEVTGVSTSAAGFNRFDFSAYDWSGRPPSEARCTEVPVCWNIHHAALHQGYVDADDYVTGGGPSLVPVDPTPRWATAGTILRPPRAILFDDTYDLGLAVEVLQGMAATLAAAGIFAGRVRTAVGSNSIIRANLLHQDEDYFTDDNSVAYASLIVDEAQSIGGEVMFLMADNLSGISETPYYDPDFGGVNLTVCRARDLDLLGRSVDRFARLQYLYVAGEFSTWDAAADTALADFATAANAISANLVAAHKYAGLLSDPPFHDTAAAVIVAAIENFFGL